MGDELASMPFPWKRMCVIGGSGSGKTTFARSLAAALRLPHVELDAVHWQNDWTEARRTETHARIAEIVRGDKWVIDGNYRSHRALLWGRAEAIVWLDYPRLTVHAGVVRRTIHRVVMRPTLWNTNNRESLRRTFSRDSVVLWSLTTYTQRRREAAGDLGDPRFGHLGIVRLRSRSAAARLLASLDGGAPSVP